MTTTNKIRTAVAIMSLIFLFPLTVMAVVITPEARQKLENEGIYENYLALLNESKIDGMDAPSEFRIAGKQAISTGIADTLHVLVLLVDFSDNPYTGGDLAAVKADFDSILFSTGHHNPTGSMTEYYLENSYGDFVIQGDVHGWYRMPQAYSYYVNGEGGIGSIFPLNSRGLTYDAVRVADSLGVDFSVYDTYGETGPDGIIDGLMIVHAGPGLEKTGDLDDMQSHKWDLGIYYQYFDGILIDDYTIQPEEYPVSTVSSVASPIGIFCHEFGHVLGLPDLYDVDYEPLTSDGAGVWSLMATGCYLGEARSPAHLDAWCKARIGFVDPIEVYENMTDVEFPQIETEPVAYRLWKDGNYGSEYFLVENRQKIGFDSLLPGEGLLIYHIDDATTYNNINVTHYHVAVEQADGFYQLEYSSSNEGDAGDPWPGTFDRRSFDDLTIPGSRGYSGLPSEVSVWKISDPGPVMTANLDIEWSRPSMALADYEFSDANGNGYLEAGESIEFYFYIRNNWLAAENATVSISSRYPGINFTIESMEMPWLIGDGAVTDNAGRPLTFILPDTLTPTYDSFFVSVVTADQSYDTAFAIEQQIGKSQILIVDDDRGSDHEEIYVNDLYRKLVPADVWNKDSAGSPSSLDLSRYNMVIWYTGDTCAAGETYLSTADIRSIEQYLDNGGNLFITGQGLAGQLQIQRPLFLQDYLHAAYSGPLFAPSMDGFDGSPIGNKLSLRFYSGSNMEYTWGEKIIPLEDAMPAFAYAFSPDGYNSLSYSGQYNLVFFDFPYESIDNNSGRYDTRDTVMFNILNFFGKMMTEVSDEVDNNLLPVGFSLEQNYPNPFNPTTTIKYTVQNNGGSFSDRITLKVFNILGREVRTLVDEIQPPGNYSVQWDGADCDDNRVASGIYFYRLTCDNKSISKKMILLK